MKELVRQRALELGFDDCRFARAVPPEHGRRYLEWLAAGRQGDMAYLERQAERRLNPERILPQVQTIVSLAVSYHRPATPDASLPANGLGRSGLAGIVARYARLPDYHQVLAKPLATLSEPPTLLSPPLAALNRPALTWLEVPLARFPVPPETLLVTPLAVFLAPPVMLAKGAVI